MENFEAITRPLILKSKSIYCNIPEWEKFRPEYPLRDERMMGKLKESYAAHKYKRLAPIMTGLRLVKEPEEIDLMKKAVEITRAGFLRVLSQIRPGMHEYEVEAEISYEFLGRGCSGHAYPPIIASGRNACILHYIKNDRVCREGELLLMDFGAEYANYAADCTRTVPVNGKYTERQRELYDACLRVFLASRELFKPGATIDEINIRVAELWEKEHVGLGLYSSADLKSQDKESPLYRKYYPHGTAHFIGLDVHDVGGKKEKLYPGMILTCEPGIYIPDEGIGIRLENDLLITKSGYEDLMTDFPLEASEIEDLMLV